MPLSFVYFFTLTLSIFSLGSRQQLLQRLREENAQEQAEQTQVTIFLLLQMTHSLFHFLCNSEFKQPQGNASKIRDSPHIF